MFTTPSLCLLLVTSYSQSESRIPHSLNHFRGIIRPASSSGEDENVKIEESTIIVPLHASRGPVEPVSSIMLASRQNLTAAFPTPAPLMPAEQSKGWKSRGIFIDCEAEMNMESDERCMTWQNAGFW